MDKTHTMAHDSGTVSHKIGTDPWYTMPLMALFLGAGYLLNLVKLATEPPSGMTVVRLVGVVVVPVGCAVGYL